MIKLTLNGEEKALDRPMTLTELTQMYGYQSDFVAVAVNFKCIPRGSWKNTTIKDGDEIEILSPQAGG